MKVHFKLLVALCITFTSCAQNKQEASTITANLTNHTALLIDVRTKEEFDAGHLALAKNIDYKSEKFNEVFSKLNRNKIIYLYCRSGNRSGKALDIAKGLGFKKVYNIGGFEDLKAAGLAAAPLTEDKR